MNLADKIKQLREKAAQGEWAAFCDNDFDSPCIQVPKNCVNEEPILHIVNGSTDWPAKLSDADAQLITTLVNNTDNILRLVETAETLEKWLPCGKGVSAEEIKAWADFIGALEPFLKEQAD